MDWIIEVYPGELNPHNASQEINQSVSQGMVLPAIS